MKDYFKIPSKAPYAWFVYGLLATLINELELIPGGIVFKILAIALAVLGLAQIIVNLVNLFRNKATINGQNVIINIVLFVVLTIISSVLGSVNISYSP